LFRNFHHHNHQLVSLFVVEHRAAGDVSILFYCRADKSLARPTSRCILFDGENISFDASYLLYI